MARPKRGADPRLKHTPGMRAKRLHRENVRRPFQARAANQQRKLAASQQRFNRPVKRRTPRGLRRTGPDVQRQASESAPQLYHKRLQGLEARRDLEAKATQAGRLSRQAPRIRGNVTPRGATARDNALAIKTPEFVQLTHERAGTIPTGQTGVDYEARENIFADQDRADQQNYRLAQSALKEGRLDRGLELREAADERAERRFARDDERFAITDDRATRRFSREDERFRVGDERYEEERALKGERTRVGDVRYEQEHGEGSLPERRFSRDEPDRFDKLLGMGYSPEEVNRIIGGDFGGVGAPGKGRGSRRLPSQSQGYYQGLAEDVGIKTEEWEEGKGKRFGDTLDRMSELNPDADDEQLTRMALESMGIDPSSKGQRARIEERLGHLQGEGAAEGLNYARQLLGHESPEQREQQQEIQKLQQQLEQLPAEGAAPPEQPQPVPEEGAAPQTEEALRLAEGGPPNEDQYQAAYESALQDPDDPDSRQFIEWYKAERGEQGAAPGLESEPEPAADAGPSEDEIAREEDALASMDDDEQRQWAMERWDDPYFGDMARQVMKRLRPRKLDSLGLPQRR